MAKQRTETGDDEVGLGELRLIEAAQGLGGCDRGMRDQYAQTGREAFGFRGPVGQQGGRRDEEARARIGLFALQDQEQREDLNRFAEPHVVGQTRAQLEAAEQVEPLHARVLVRSKLRVQLGAWLDARQALRLTQVLKGIGQPGTSHDLRPVVFFRCLCIIARHACQKA
ncbi:hypothetical protein R69746_08787 [Paraburkholderia aspalathi]|nr:hypothetical protein R69746_08787 [Paraburkholderia aspalathi]